MLDKIRAWLCRRAIRMVSRVDYGLKSGDKVESPGWSLTTLTVIDINWALLAAAVKLGPQGSIVVWPVWSLRKVL